MYATGDAVFVSKPHDHYSGKSCTITAVVPAEYRSDDSKGMRDRIQVEFEGGVSQWFEETDLKRDRRSGREEVAVPLQRKQSVFGRLIGR